MFVVAFNILGLKIEFSNGQWVMGYGLWIITKVYGISPLLDAPNAWVITGYGVSEVWFRTESTVVAKYMVHACIKTMHRIEVGLVP